MEVWKDIKNYEGRYQVSTDGLVKSVDRTVYYKDGRVRKQKGQILKQGTNAYGYAVVYLSKDGICKTVTVHRLVAEAFLPNPDNLPQVNHKDECKTNSQLSNLEWCDRSYNCRYGTCQKRRTEKLINKDTMSKPVSQYTMDGNLVNTYPSVSEAKRQTGFDNSHICQCCNKRLKQAYGYKWEYVY